jgi:hypothetical protein
MGGIEGAAARSLVWPGVTTEKSGGALNLRAPRFVQLLLRQYPAIDGRVFAPHIRNYATDKPSDAPADECPSDKDRADNNRNHWPPPPYPGVAGSLPTHNGDPPFCPKETAYFYKNLDGVAVAQHTDPSRLFSSRDI